MGGEAAAKDMEPLRIGREILLMGSSEVSIVLHSFSSLGLSEVKVGASFIFSHRMSGRGEEEFDCSTASVKHCLRLGSSESREERALLPLLLRPDPVAFCHRRARQLSVPSG